MNGSVFPSPNSARVLATERAGSASSVAICWTSDDDSMRRRKE
jgi:hypothetical protein